MHLRSALVVLLAVCAQATLTATTAYSFGATSQISFALGNAYAAGVWTEDYTGTLGSTTEQIVCVVGLTVADEQNTCGNPGPGSSQHISVDTTGGQPANSGILPAGTTNYLEVDGDPTWGAPVSTDMTGLTVGDQYQIAFDQASNEEDGNNKAYSDRWQVFIMPGAGGGEYICPVCSPAVDPGSITPVFTSDPMANPGKASTPWELETFTFVASQASEILEFVTDAVGTPGFAPPFLDLAGVSGTQVPEPGTWTLTILGAGLVFAGSRLRRRFSTRR